MVPCSHSIFHENTILFPCFLFPTWLSTFSKRQRSLTHTCDFSTHMVYLCLVSIFLLCFLCFFAFSLLQPCSCCIGHSTSHHLGWDQVGCCGIICWGIILNFLTRLNTAFPYSLLCREEEQEKLKSLWSSHTVRCMMTILGHDQRYPNSFMLGVFHLGQPKISQFTAA